MQVSSEHLCYCNLCTECRRKGANFHSAEGIAVDAAYDIRHKSGFRMTAFQSQQHGVTIHNGATLVGKLVQPSFGWVCQV